MTDRSASAAVKVAVGPTSAFTAFTHEIDSWWVRGQHGYRAYTAEDLEGHRWTFVQARPTMI